MSTTKSVRFIQSCPTCGRRIEIRTSLLGCTVACQHCQAEFVATASSNGASHHLDSNDLLARAEAALQRSATASRPESPSSATV